MPGILSVLSPVVQALIATTFTWSMRALGAALVFGAKRVPRNLRCLFQHIDLNKLRV